MNKNLKAFTLLELSIVIVVISLIFIGGFETSKYFMNQNNINATIVKLNTIQNALDIYVIENGKLPCPAGLKKNNGVSVLSCNSTNTTDGIYITSESGVVSGAVPYEDLNLTPDVSHDSWNGKIVYSVSVDATKDIKKMNNASYKGIKIYDNLISRMITDRAIYSLVSNGKNKFGAFDYKTNSKLPITGIGGYESKNVADSNTNENVYFSNHKIDDKTNDDLLKYKTRMQIINETNLEDISCFIDSGVISKLVDSSSIPEESTPVFVVPTENYLGYNDEIESTDNKYKIKCFKYGRLGIFKYAE